MFFLVSVFCIFLKCDIVDVLSEIYIVLLIKLKIKLYIIFLLILLFNIFC